jgi:serine/threonine protein kinase
VKPPPDDPADDVTDLSQAQAADPVVTRPAPTAGIWVGPQEEPTRYERLKHVGGGAEGAVFQARFVGLGTTSTRVVALKEYRRPAGAAKNWPHDGTWSRLSDQAGLLAGLPSHPHLVKLQSVFLGAVSSVSSGSSLGAGQNGSSIATVFDTPFVVMEWVEGRNPVQELAARPVELPERAEWVSQLASAVDLLHSVTRTEGNPIIHGDIKPANCVITPGRGLVLVDTGALTRQEASEVSQGLHSPPYASPEVMTAPGRARRPATDLFSLGAMAYLLLTGEPPPDAGSEDYLERARKRLERETFEGLDPERCDAIRAALLVYLDQDPATRETVNPLVWSARLRELVSPPEQTPRRPVRGRRTVTAVAAATAVTAIALGGLAFQHLPFFADDPATPSTRSTSTAAGDSPAITSTSDFAVFGKKWADFDASTGGSSLTITPPLGADEYDHLWGFYLPLGNCSASVQFDARLLPLPAAANFGLAVAPRSQLSGDQPAGASVQYEWEGKDVSDQPGSYVRPAQLPGEAWSVKVSPVPVPDVRQKHRVRIDASGTSLVVSIDGRRQATFEQDAVECGGVAFRVWGAAASITSVRITGT